MEKLYYQIGEVAEIMKESVSAVRFWTNSFPRFLNPKRNAKGNRLYTASDIETLKQLHHLVKVKGMTLEGAESEMLRDRASVERSVKAIGSLREIRAQLAEIRKSL